jgi:hypothetical protein
MARTLWCSRFLEQRAPMPTARSGVAAAVLEGRMFVFGGEGPAGTSRSLGRGRGKRSPLRRGRPAIFRLSSQANSSWLSISRPRRRSGLRSAANSSCAPTRWSSDKTRVRRASRHRGGRVAARGARAVTWRGAAYRHRRRWKSARIAALVEELQATGYRAPDWGEDPLTLY